MIRPWNVKEEEIDQFVNRLKAFTEENMNTPPKGDFKGDLSEEELSSILSDNFNTLMKNDTEPITKEQEKSFFDGVLSLHPYRNQPRKGLISKFKKWIQQVDPKVPFYFDYQRPDYSVYNVLLFDL